KVEWKCKRRCESGFGRCRRPRGADARPLAIRRHMLRIGTRGSRLALWQANFVAERLRAQVDVELIEIQTAGDQVRDVPLAQIGGEGVFTKELQRALLDGTVDVAVHSL